MQLTNNLGMESHQKMCHILQKKSFMKMSIKINNKGVSRTMMWVNKKIEIIIGQLEQKI